MSHLPFKQIDPITTGLLRVTVKDGAGALVTDATATATVYDATGKRVAANSPLTNAGAGVYTLTVLASWSDAGGGVPVLGVYRAVITVTRSGMTRTKQIRFLVDFTE